VMTVAANNNKTESAGCFFLAFQTIFWLRPFCLATGRPVDVAPTCSETSAGSPADYLPAGLWIPRCGQSTISDEKNNENKKGRWRQPPGWKSPFFFGSFLLFFFVYDPNFPRKILPWLRICQFFSPIDGANIILSIFRKKGIIFFIGGCFFLKDSNFEDGNLSIFWGKKFDSYLEIGRLTYRFFRLIIFRSIL